MDLKVKSLTLDSREVAKMLGKKHMHLLRDIAKNIEYLTETKNGLSEITETKIGLSEFFQENQYKDSTGRKVKRYDITKKGCEFLAHKLTGKKGAIFTATYINKFHEMEQQLSNPKLPFEEKTKLIPTTWKGQPVIELQELAKMIGINGAFIHWHFQKEKLTLKENELREYKRENKTNRGQASLSILYKETVIAICKHFNVYEKYKDIIENYFKTDNKIEDKTSKVLTEKHIEIIDKIPREELISMRKMIKMLTQEIEKDVKEIQNILGKIEDHKAHINVYTSVLNQF